MGKRGGSLSSDDLDAFFSDTDSDVSRSEKRHRTEKKEKREKKEKSDKKEKKDKSDKKEKKDKKDKADKKKEKSDKKEKKDKHEKTSAGVSPTAPTVAPLPTIPIPAASSIGGGAKSLLSATAKPAVAPAPPLQLQPPGQAPPSTTAAAAVSILATGSKAVVSPPPPAHGAAAPPSATGGAPPSSAGLGGAVSLLAPPTMTPPTAPLSVEESKKSENDISHLVAPDQIKISADAFIDDEDDDAANDNAKPAAAAGASTKTTGNNAADGDSFSDSDSLSSWEDSSGGGDDANDAAVLASLDALIAKAKENAAKPAVDLHSALIADGNKLAAAASSGTLVVAANQTNSESNNNGRGQLILFADEEAEAMDALATKLKLPEADTQAKSRIKKMHYVDHSAVEYPPIEKNFYIAPSDVAALTDKEVRALYKELDGAKVRGTDVPRPMRSWVGIGLNHATVDLLREKGFAAPFAMQSLAMPSLMAGRDLLAIAKTGSGKTLAYTLPLIRHVANQPRGGYKRGPIGLVLVPTSVLAQQVYSVIADFAKASRLKVVASFPVTDLNTNIKQCIAGCDIMVATPGRLLDLCTNGSKGVVNLPDCSFVVIDEADRMFDAGFREHVEAFLRNCRPDRQLALISATMSDGMKIVAKTLLNNNANNKDAKKDSKASTSKRDEGEGKKKSVPSYIELSTGGRPSPSSNVAQHFEFFEQEVYSNSAEAASKKAVVADPRFSRLLEILSAEWTSHLALDAAFLSSAAANNNADAAAAALAQQQKNDTFVPPRFLIFVERIVDCDDLFAKLHGNGFEDKIGVLNSDSTPAEQQLIIESFNEREKPILIATGSAERGLDVYGLEFVINYWMPDHYEAYVHRVGRTGRAGKRGTAYSFFVKNADDHLAFDIYKELAKAESTSTGPVLTTVTEGLRERALAHEQRVKSGTYEGPSGRNKGFGGKSYKFTSKEEKRQLREDMKASGFGDVMSSDDDDSSSDDSEDGYDTRFNDPTIVEADDDEAGGSGDNAADGSGGAAPSSSALVAYKGGVVAFSNATSAAIDAWKAHAASATAMHYEATGGGGDMLSGRGGGNGGPQRIRMLESNYEVNDLPQAERLALMRSTFLEEVQQKTNTTITKKGEFINRRAARGKEVAKDLVPLYLEIRGETRESITAVFRAFEAAQREAKRRMASRLGGVNKNVVF